ncbi:MAG: DNA/RNA non-specific endonuclease [Vicingaceae bacterium]
MRLLFKLIGFLLIVVALEACTLSTTALVEQKVSSPHLRFEADPIEDFVLYQGFVVNFNQTQKVPNYTIHRITPEQLQEKNGIRAQRSNYFIVDERVEVYSAKRSDYYKSGYDRGHYVPAGDFVYSQELKDETFTYTNVSPQLKELNRYGWKYLEAAIREKVLEWNCVAFVVTGSLFKAGNKTIGENKVGVPDQLYKIAFYPDSMRMYAFRMNNSTEEYSGSLESYQFTVDELEALSQVDFFEKLKDEDESRLESEILVLKK